MASKKSSAKGKGKSPVKGKGSSGEKKSKTPREKKPKEKKTLTSFDQLPEFVRINVEAASEKERKNFMSNF